MKIQVEGNPSLFRDSESGAIVNSSDSELQSYLELKRKKLEEKEEIQKLKSDVSEIKDMMKIILSKLESSS